MIKLILLVSMVTIQNTVLAQDKQDSLYKVFNTNSGHPGNLEEILDLAGEADVLIFGEEHNDSASHVLQEILYRELLKTYEDVTLSLEMFERDVQLILDEYLAGLITEAKLKEEGRVWRNYKDYAPLVNLAKEKGQRVVAANVPGRYANMVSRKGLEALEKLKKQAGQYYATFKLPEEGDPYRRKFFDAMGEHGHGMGPNLFYAQMLRDATMAESILMAWRKNRKTKILHLTGKFHSDEGLGTVAALKQKKRNLKILSISCFASEDFESPDWKKHRDKADFIILTPPDGPKTY